MFLACQKYGFRPFPAKIPEPVFDELRAALAPEERALVEQCYRLDTNQAAAAPDPADGLSEWHHGAPDRGAGPVYVLRSSTDISKEAGAGGWWPTFEKLQRAFRAAARTVWTDKAALLRDPRSTAFIKKFFVSVTEEEFSRGLLWVKEEHQRTQTLVFKRVIADLADLAGSSAADPAHGAEAKKLMAKFIDMQGSAVDEEAQHLLKEQVAMVPAHVETIAYAPISWGPGIDPDKNAEHAAYLRKFLDDFCSAMTRSIRAGAEKLAIAPDAVVEEAEQHLRFALVRAERFKSTDSTMKVERRAGDYLGTRSLDRGSNSLSKGSALVVFGRSGAGKTYLLSKVMADCLRVRTAGGVVVIRFLGTTPRSSNVHALLTSVCEQLRRAYEKDKDDAGKDDAVPSDIKELRAYFLRALTTWPSAEHPLTLFLDSVDQLDDSNAGRRLDWLPVTSLPEHVRLVVSSLPDYPEFQCLSILQAKLGDRAASHSVEVDTISQPEEVLLHLLRLQGRTLTAKQLEHVLDAFARRTPADAAGTPLWLTIVAQEVSAWASYDDVKHEIKPAVRDLIVDLFTRLESAHGKELVRAALAYITLAKHGVSETELNHLLSLQDEVLADVYEWWVPPVRIVPPLLVTRLLTELAPYLTRRGDGSGVELVSWYHRQFWEAALAWLFDPAADGAAVRRQRHAELAAYFGGAWAGRCKPYSEALRKSVQRFFPGEAAAERNVPHQPRVLEGALFAPSAPLENASKYTLNTRRLHELVPHLIASRQGDAARRELVSPEYVGAMFALGNGAALMREYAAAQREFKGTPAAAELGKCQAAVGRVLKHLEQEPPLFALQMCSQQPDDHPLCVAAREVLVGPPGEGGASKSGARVVEWINKTQELDPCQLEIREHDGNVKAVMYIPDTNNTDTVGGAGEARIASASADGTIKVMSAVSGEVLMELRGHEGAVNCVHASKDGTRLVSGGDDQTVRVWDVKTGKLVSTMSGHDDRVLSVCFSPDGKKIASGARDKTVRIWDAATGAPVGSPLRGHRYVPFPCIECLLL